MFSPRRDARRAVQRGYPRNAGSVRLCRTYAAVLRLLEHRLVDVVVLDVKADRGALALPARFPRIPMYVLSTFRPDDGVLIAACHAAGFAGILAGISLRSPWCEGNLQKNRRPAGKRFHLFLDA